jgi:hypothetical protein
MEDRYRDNQYRDNYYDEADYGQEQEEDRVIVEYKVHVPVSEREKKMEEDRKYEKQLGDERKYEKPMYVQKNKRDDRDDDRDYERE